MTKLTLKDAWIVAHSGGTEGLYEIVIACRMKDVEGVIRETTGLNVEIKNKRNDTRNITESNRD